MQEAGQLDTLVRDADVIFMLTDSRESRWLPSLLAATHNKLLINAALGFDSWIVMRHGCGPDAQVGASAHEASDAQAVRAQKSADSEAGEASTSAAPEPAAATRLGCYFCNDVVAPANSLAGRSMDEQCTVVRPGLARIAGAHATEMFAALCQHPAWLRAPVDTSAARQAGSGSAAAAQPLQQALGAVPHMLRGGLMGFSQTHMTGQANSCCSACCASIVQAYRDGGAAFVMHAISDDNLLESVSGLEALRISQRRELQQAAGASGQSSEDDEWEAL